MSTTKESALATMTAHGLTVASVFIPLSQSRNAHKGGKSRATLSLNWRVTLMHNGRAVYSCDYSAGSAHCPASKLSVREYGHADSLMRHELLSRECETGRAAGLLASAGVGVRGRDILPDACDVMSSLLLDGSAVDCCGFADWCGNFGYDADSITARATYDACLSCGLALRAALGDAVLAELREAFADY
jgi:hypothetical protein